MTDFPNDVLKRAAPVRLAIFDVDGVLTDGKLFFTDDGREIKAFHAHDGLGLKRLQSAGVTVAIITTRESPIVSHRMAELGVDHVYQGQKDKLAVFSSLCAALKMESEVVAYTGDDLPDLPLIQRVGLGIAVANAHPAIREAAHWVTRIPGGEGAAREVSDLILSAREVPAARKD